MVWKWLGDEINQMGSEGGRILRDEEYDGQCRITLERCKTYDAITCGVYGDMMHTAYASSKESALIYEKMKKDLRECKIVCVNRYCMNLLYAPYWGKQR